MLHVRATITVCPWRTQGCIRAKMYSSMSCQDLARPALLDTRFKIIGCNWCRVELRLQLTLVTLKRHSSSITGSCKIKGRRITPLKAQGSITRKLIHPWSSTQMANCNNNQSRNHITRSNPSRSRGVARDQTSSWPKRKPYSMLLRS